MTRQIHAFADLRASRAALASFLVMGAVWGAIAAMIPDLRAALDINDSLFGLILFTTAAVSAGAMMLAPRLGRGLGARALPLATAAMAASLLLPGHLSVPITFALAFALVGGASGLVEVLMNDRVAGIEAATGRPLMNLNHAGYSLSFFATAVLTGLARDAGLSAAMVFTVVALASAPLVAISAESPITLRGSDARRADGRPATESGLAALGVLGGLVILLASLAEAGTETWSAMHLERILGASPAEGALGPALLGLSMGLGRLAGQALSRRIGEVVLMQGGAGLAAAGALLAAGAPAPGAAFAGFAMLGFGASVIVPIALAMVGRGVAETRRATALAQASVLGFVGYIAGPALMGLLSDLVSLRLSFLAVGVTLFALPLLAPLLARHADLRR